MVGGTEPLPQVIELLKPSPEVSLPQQ